MGSFRSFFKIIRILLFFFSPFLLRNVFTRSTVSSSSVHEFIPRDLNSGHLGRYLVAGRSAAVVGHFSRSSGTYHYNFFFLLLPLLLLLRPLRFLPLSPHSSKCNTIRDGRACNISHVLCAMLSAYQSRARFLSCPGIWSAKETNELSYNACALVAFPFFFFFLLLLLLFLFSLSSLSLTHSLTHSRSLAAVLLAGHDPSLVWH